MAAASAAPRRLPTLAALAGFMALVLTLLSPALYNRSPLLFPDSAGYFRSGEASLDAVGWLIRSRLAPAPHGTAAVPPPHPDRGGDGVSTSRSVFYGIPIVVLYRIGGIWLIALAQVVLTAWVLLAGLNRLHGAPSPWRDHVAIIIAGLFGGLAVYAVTVMPDILAGLMILALAIVIGFHHRLTAGQIRGWLALILFAVLAHKGHLAVLGIVVVLAAVAALALRRFALRPFLALALVFGLGLAGHAAVDLAVTRVTGAPPVPTAFLLARVVGDGTALPYLQANCPRRDLLLCRYRDRFPMTEDQFLWSTAPVVGVVGHLGQPERRRLAAESRDIIAGAIAADPLRQARATLTNMARQNVTIGVSTFGMLTGLDPKVAPGFGDALAGYHQSRVFEGAMPLALISRVMLATYALAILALAVLVARRPALLFSGEDRARALQVIIAGVIINACVFSAVSSISDRYQGRVAWLIPLVVVTLLWPRSQRSVRAAPSQARKISSVETR